MVNQLVLLKSPNKLPVSERRAAFEDLKLDYQLALRNGWTPESVKNDKKDSSKITGPATVDDLWEVYEIMKQQNYSDPLFKGSTLLRTSYCSP